MRFVLSFARTKPAQKMSDNAANSAKTAVSSRRRFFTLVPNIVFELGLTPYALSLYFTIRRTAGESGECFRSGNNLARMCGMSTGMVSKAKHQLARPRSKLGGKALICIKQAPAVHGGKARHCIKIIDIWSINKTYYERTTRSRSLCEL